MARRYTRDARGRFASGGFSGQTGGRGARLMSAGRPRAGGGARIQATAPAGAFRRGQSRRPTISRAEPLTTGRGTLAARASLRRSRANLAANPSPAQRGAVTRANRYANMAKASNRQALGASPAGRFVRGKGSKPAAAPTARPKVPARGTLAARGRLRDARGAAAGQGLNPSTGRQLTRANRDAAAAIRGNRQRISQSPTGRLVPGQGRKGGPASNIRPTNRYPRKPLVGDPATATNGIRRTGRNTARLAEERQSQAYARRLGRATSNYQAAQQARAAGGDAKAMARAKRSERVARRARDTYRQPKSVVKPYRPATLGGQFDKIDRQINRQLKSTVDELKAISDQAKKVRARTDPMRRRWERSNAKAIADRRKKGIDGEIARAELGTVGGAAGRKAISRRMNRALDAAARGSKPAKRAVSVYLDQLAGMGPGKPSRGRNNLRPGPRNTKGTPKRRRKGKG